jgi:hypothetical protein
MTKKLIRDYLISLKRRRDNAIGKVSNDIQAKINNVVDLYEDRKITIYTTADKLIDGLMAKNDKARAKGVKEYEKAVEKFKDKERVSERQTKALEKARETKQIKGKLNKATDKEKEGLGKFVSKVKETFKDRKIYSVKYILFSRNGASKTGGVLKDGIRLYPIWTRPPWKIANIKVNDFIKSLEKRLVPKWEGAMFGRLVMIMGSDDTFKRDLEILDHVDAIRIESIDDVSDIDARDINMRDVPLRESAQHLSIYHRYIETEVDAEYHNVKDAIENKKYKENECWINSLNELYEGTELMREKRGKLAKTLNRDKVLELIKMTEDEYIEKGATINQMENVFKYFNIPVRLYNFNNEIIYRHDPATRTHTRIATFNALVKNNHIYTMNFDLKSIYQKNQIEEKSTVSQNYYLNDREAPVKYIAFDNIDELLKLTDEEEYYLIQVDNDLVKTLHQLKTAKYEPFIKYQSGMLSEIKVRFKYKQLKKTVLYNIVSQNLSKQSLHCEVIVKSSDKYNKMTAMFYFNKSIFKETSKSKYSEIDVEILDECRTIVPIGYFDKEISLTKLTEIDRNKAFTSALCDITRIPVFNEFDIWMPYDNQDIKMMDALTLYIVEVNEGNIFFNKKFNLTYGKFLRKMVRKNINMKIHYYKQPHRFIKVDYEKAVNELWKQNISDDKDEDKMAKKTIANINIGLLEKSGNKHQQDF